MLFGSLMALAMLLFGPEPPPGTAPGSDLGKAFLRQVEPLTAAGRFAQAERLIHGRLAREDSLCRRPSPRVLQAMAELCLHRQAFAQALDWTARAQTLLPDDPDLLVAGATALMELGRLDEADAQAARASALAPSRAAGPVIRATILGRRGRPREALALLQPWLERQPEDPTLHEALAEAWERAGEPAQARQAREAAAFWYRTDE